MHLSSAMSDQCLDLIEDISSVVNESSLFNDSLDEKVMDNVISSNSEVCCVHNYLSLLLITSTNLNALI